jgi:hypothetical protein
MTQPLEPFRRVHYYGGRLLTAEDFAAEQEYHRGKRRLQNQLLLGMGRAAGLECHWSRRKGLIVEPGVAIDCMGREIVVPAPQHVDVPSLEGRFHLAVAAAERGVMATPVPGSEDLVPAMIEEGFELLLLESPPGRGHKLRPDGRRRCCGEDHPVPLARLRWKMGRLRVKSSARGSSNDGPR